MRSINKDSARHRKCSKRKLFLKCYGFLKRKQSECIVSTFLPSTCSASYEVIAARHIFFFCPLQILQDLWNQAARCGISSQEQNESIFSLSFLVLIHWSFYDILRVATKKEDTTTILIQRTFDEVENERIVKQFDSKMVTKPLIL